MLTQQRLKELLRYNPKTGDWTWRVSKYRVRAGNKAGCISRTNRGRHLIYIIRVDQRNYLASRLAFLYMLGRWPRPFAEHKDRNGLNNKWSNLREANQSQNGGNAIWHAERLKGVTRRPHGKYRARITVMYKEIDLGTFDTAEEAHAAYMEAARQHFGEFARSS